MSRAGAEVRFPDGTIKYTLYDGTTDILGRRLYADQEAAWDSYRLERSKVWSDPYGDYPINTAWEIFDVVIYSDYGGGRHWPGKATLIAVEPEYQEPYEDPIYETTRRGYPWESGLYKDSWNPP